MFQDLVPAVMFLGLKMLNIVTEVALCCLVEHVALTTTTTTTTTTGVNLKMLRPPLYCSKQD